MILGLDREERGRPSDREICEWPSISETTFGWIPRLSISVAAVCRRCAPPIAASSYEPPLPLTGVADAIAILVNLFRVI